MNKASGTPEENFWEWFKQDEARIFSHETNQEPIFDEAQTNLQKVNPELAFEISRVLPNGKREFVISADGIKSAFPAVELLHKQAPVLERWIWIKFRPRMPIKTLELK